MLELCVERRSQFYSVITFCVNYLQVMSNLQRSSIETATVTFFSNVISCHPENQHLFANVLCDVIRGQGPGTNSKY